MQKRKFDELVSYFNKKVSEMEIETKYKMELLGMVTAFGSAHEKETHDKRTETHGVCLDTISRKAAIDALGVEPLEYTEYEEGLHTKWADAKEALEQLPSAQPEREDYTEMKREFLRMASYIDSLLVCSDEQKETLMNFISRIADDMPWTERD